MGVLKKDKQQKGVALTFDDGPDPAYTPQLLTLLDQHNIKATFFVLGEKAEKHPEIIRDIHQQGHLLAIHNYTHVPNWMLLPKQVREQHIHKTANILYNITGEKPTLYRPPWGLLNLFDYSISKQFHIVLWSKMFGDWKWGEQDVAKRSAQLVKQFKKGDIVVLHDSDQTFGAKKQAPTYMLRSLAQSLEQLQHTVPFVRLDELQHVQQPFIPLWKKIVVKTWLLWDKAILKTIHITPVDEENKFIQIRIRPYSGKGNILLENGDMLSKGDRIVELHLNNEMLHELGKHSTSIIQLSVQLIQRTKQLLPKIKAYIDQEQFADVKGLYSITMVHQGTTRLGFTTQDLPDNIFGTWTKKYLQWMMMIVHPQGVKRLKNQSKPLHPKIITMSRKALFEKYQ